MKRSYPVICCNFIFFLQIVSLLESLYLVFFSATILFLFFCTLCKWGYGGQWSTWSSSQPAETVSLLAAHSSSAEARSRTAWEETGTDTAQAGNSTQYFTTLKVWDLEVTTFSQQFPLNFKFSFLLLSSRISRNNSKLCKNLCHGLNWSLEVGFFIWCFSK